MNNTDKRVVSSVMQEVKPSAVMHSAAERRPRCCSKTGWGNTCSHWTYHLHSLCVKEQLRSFLCPFMVLYVHRLIRVGGRLGWEMRAQPHLPVHTAPVHTAPVHTAPVHTAQVADSVIYISTDNVFSGKNAPYKRKRLSQHPSTLGLNKALFQTN